MKLPLLLTILLSWGSNVLAQSLAQCWPAGISQTTYPFCRLLDPYYALHWSINQQQITFAVYVSGVYKSIALGLTNGGVTGADIWVARSDDAQPW
ncbi:hypothetical protein CEUSTIGMA_g7687.t1 [Chlamydomonas eustigma]|uniref:DOMON domain-containing protein n=1 Tax=Chlamydomonas eustigma TaxID=1157962 RepID=A0A250XBH8_9CHLO|nr:hypothetical protein CEUSTIGMA_g7687.t1 [Chlamydomonas eustigma]|eukprot:GAX80249.1 hypothetical protein CEUSTIGMA_g7687.t1 [Chlamydomonas eustigma]